MSKEKLYGEILLWTGTTIFISSLLRLLSSYTTSIDKNKSSKYHIIEVCLSDIESVKNAIAGGVNSIELCVDRQAGGITPSYGLIKEACRLVMSTDIKINILIRPRDGNFVYSDDEFDVILRDIIIARDAGAHGIHIMTYLSLI